MCFKYSLVSHSASLAALYLVFRGKFQRGFKSFKGAEDVLTETLLAQPPGAGEAVAGWQAVAGRARVSQGHRSTAAQASL